MARTRTTVADEKLSLEALDTLFKGFADPTRIRIVNVLAAGELCVCDVVEILDLPQPAVSRHLAYLRRAGLVTTTRAGKFAHYRLAESTNVVHEAVVASAREHFVDVAALRRERAKATRRVETRVDDPC